MPVLFYQHTAPGDRRVNQDSMARILADHYVLCVVADGLGGHQGGELASRYFCESLLALAPHYQDAIQYAPQATLTAWVADAVIQMAGLFADVQLAKSAYTTCAILYLDAQRVLTAHCGDSRIYRCTADKILWRTQDHSVMQEKLVAGALSDQELVGYPYQHQLTRSINGFQACHVEVACYPAAMKGETFIVCSDGFWVGMQPSELFELAQPRCSETAVAKLVERVIHRAGGKSDNVTVQWLRCL
jgi:protein phosphatase